MFFVFENIVVLEAKNIYDLFKKFLLFLESPGGVHSSSFSGHNQIVIGEVDCKKVGTLIYALGKHGQILPKLFKLEPRNVQVVQNVRVFQKFWKIFHKLAGQNRVLWFSEKSVVAQV